MKQKLFTLMTLLVMFVTGAWADSIDDLVAISSDWTFIADDITSNGTTKLTANTLYCDDLIFAPTANDKATNKGSSTFAGSSHLNSLRIKKNQDMLVFKVSGACSITFYTNSHSSRGLRANSSLTEAAKESGIGSGDLGTQTYGTTSWVLDITQATTIVLTSEGDFFLAGFVLTYPGTSYTMTAAVDDETHGTASVSSASVKEGNSVTFTATENLGWKFKNWTVTGSDPEEIASTDNPYTIASVSGDVNLTANYEAVTTYNVTISAGETGALGKYCDNKVITQNENTTVTLPAKNSWFYKEGYTATGWTDGTNDYAFGGTFTLTGNVTIYPKFRANTKAIGDANATVTWNLTKPASGPIHIEGTTGYLVTTAEVDGETIDVPMYWDNTSGKVDNRSRDTNNDCQVNNGSKFSIPAVKGMTVTLAASYAITATIDGNDMTATTASPYTATGTYTGTEDDVEVVINGGSWFQSITATYKVGYDAPTIEKSDVFNFEHKGFPVTITAAEGTLNVSTDGTNYEAQVSPYVTYATATTTYYAKVTGADYNDSEVASLEVVNSYDTSKKYIAWVSASKPTTDLLYNALEEVYNVVPTNYEDTKTVTVEDNIKDADLIFMSETIGGGGNLAKSMKVFVGVKPLINTKLYACTTASGRWGWGTAADIDDDSTIEFDKNYKFLNGVTFTTGKTVSFFQEGTTGKRLNTLEFTAAPTNNVNFGITKSNVSMHAIVDADNLDKQYLGLGLHSNNVAKYSDNAIIVVKNAIEMMLAGEALNTEVTTVSGTISVSGWNSFSSSYALDLSTITGGTAYVATAAANGSVTVAETDKVVAAGTGLLIKGTAGEAFTIDVATANANFSGTNLLVGLPNGGEVAKANNTDTWNYVFGWTDPTDPGFYLVNATLPTLGAGKAYLQTNAALTANPGARLNIVFEGETTAINGIEEVAPVTKTRKVVKNGRLVIETANGEFTVSGARVK